MPLKWVCFLQAPYDHNLDYDHSVLGQIKSQIIFDLSNPAISYEEHAADLKILYSAILAK
jgi:hypothetical protein